jgi:hypothetical protein
MKGDWQVEDGWSSDYSWFLVDEGKIWYSFTSQAAAEAFQREHFMSDKLLLPASRVQDVLMTGPEDYRAWICKSPVHVTGFAATMTDVSRACD